MNHLRMKVKTIPIKNNAFSAIEEAIPANLQEIVRRARESQNDQILRLRQVKEKSGRGTSTIYADMARGVFPPSFPIGQRAMGFSANEIDAWISACSTSSCPRTPNVMRAFVQLLIDSRKGGSASKQL